MWFKKASSGITEEHSSFSCVTCGVCDFGQVLSPLCAQHPHHANGNNAWVLPPVRMNGGNPRKAFSLTRDKSQLLWALSLQSQHSPGKSPERDTLGAEGVKGTGTREYHSDWVLASPGTAKKESQVQWQSWQCHLEKGRPEAASTQTCGSLTALPPAPSSVLTRTPPKSLWALPESCPPSQPARCQPQATDSSHRTHRTCPFLMECCLQWATTCTCPNRPPGTCLGPGASGWVTDHFLSPHRFCLDV